MDVDYKNNTECCRLCLRSEATFYIYVGRATVDMISTLCSVTVRKDDGLPSRICNQCMELLQAFNDFRQQCIKTDKLLVARNNIYISEGTIKIEPFCDESVQFKESKDTGGVEGGIVKVKTEEPVKSETKVEQFESVICNEDLDNAEPNVLGDEKVSCDVCNKSIKATYIQIHLRRHHSLEKTIKCNICNEVFKDVYVLISHKRTEHNAVLADETVSCDVCNKSVKANYIKRHLRLKHSHEETNYCNEVFKDNKEVISHNETEHNVVAEEKVSCEVCNKSMKATYMKRHLRLQHSSKREHMKVHTSEGPHQCPSCPEVFAQLYNLKCHFTASHKDEKDGSSKLADCQAPVPSDHSQRHLMTHSDERPFECDMCRKKFKSKRDVKKHMTVVHSELVACNFCGKKVSRLYLKSHVRDMHIPQHRAKCDICNKEFKCEKAMLAHQKIHSTKYKCQFCESTFRSISAKRVHEASHIGIKSHQCPSCPQAFVQKTHLKRHFTNNHSDEVASEPQTSDGTQNSEEMLYKKSLILSDIKRTVCHLCGASVRICYLKRHMVSHSEERPVKCSKCPKMFKAEDNRNFHIATVHKELVSCDICNKKMSANHLKTHMKLVHFPQEKAMCDICNKEFKNKVLMDLHRLRHTKRFKCSYCDSMFAESTNRRQHERLHTGETPYKCPCCPKAYAQLPNMKSHFKHNHRGIEFSEVYKRPPKKRDTGQC